MNHTRQKSFVLIASILLALVGAWATSRSSVRRASVEQERSARKSLSGPREHNELYFVEPLPVATAQFDISQSVIAGGGGTSSGTLNGMTIKVDGTIGQLAAGTNSTSSNGQFSVTGGFWQAESAAAPTPTPTPTPNPNAPTILIEEGTVNKAVALDSVTQVRGPFPILTNYNFSADHHTRVILFTSNLGLTQPNASVLTVQAAGFDLLVENVGAVTGVVGLNASYVVVRLPDGLPPGGLPLTVTLNGNMSNIAILSISP